MNRPLSKWLAENPGGAVVVTALLGLLPLRGVGLAFFLPGAVPALVTLVRGPRAGVLVASGAGLLLVVAVALTGRPASIGLISAAWLLVPTFIQRGENTCYNAVFLVDPQGRPSRHPRYASAVRDVTPLAHSRARMAPSANRQLERGGLQ